MSATQNDPDSPVPLEESKAAQAGDVGNVSEEIVNVPSTTAGITENPKETRSGRSTSQRNEQEESYTPYDVGRVLMDRMNDIENETERRWKEESRLAEKRMEMFTRQVTGRMERTLNELEMKMMEKLEGVGSPEKDSRPTTPAYSPVSPFPFTPIRREATQMMSMSPERAIPEEMIWRWGPPDHQYEKSEASKLTKYRGGMDEDIDLWIAKIEGQAQTGGLEGCTS